MKAEKITGVPENTKFTEDNSKITHKQEQNLQNKIIKKQPHKQAIRKAWKEWERSHLLMENGKLFY